MVTSEQLTKDSTQSPQLVSFSQVKILVFCWVVELLNHFRREVAEV